jgi:glutathione synthase/RimK-type ligase-like ATP-grasp enzyme
MTKQFAHTTNPDAYYYRIEEKTRKGWRMFGRGYTTDKGDKLAFHKLLKRNQPPTPPRIVIEWSDK